MVLIYLRKGKRDNSNLKEWPVNGRGDQVPVEQAEVHLRPVALAPPHELHLQLPSDHLRWDQPILFPALTL